MESIKKMSHLLQKKKCILFLNEKKEIASCKGDNLLNNKTEILDTCRRRNKYKLKSCDSKKIPLHYSDFVTSYYQIYLPEDW